jgi:hypothetical protein
MFVDYDDFVSCQLAGHVARHADAHGWYLNAGFIFDGSRFLYAVHNGFHMRCGTSHIVRTSLLGVPATMEDADEHWVQRTLGSHSYIRSDMTARGTPLSHLPFPGAISRIGYVGNTSEKPGIRRLYFPGRFIATRPHRFVGRLTRLRPLRSKYRREFFGGNPILSERRYAAERSG